MILISHALFVSCKSTASLHLTVSEPEALERMVWTWCVQGRPRRLSSDHSYRAGELGLWSASAALQW